jgi:hypothetical protein
MNKYRKLATLVYNRAASVERISVDDIDTASELQGLGQGFMGKLKRLNQLKRDKENIGDLHDLIKFASVASIATNAQWLFYGRQVGLQEQELLVLLAALSPVTGQSVETLYGFDGNTVRKLGGRGFHAKAASNRANVEVWLSGHLEADEESTLRTALEELLAGADLVLDSCEPSVRGSFYQKFKFLGDIARYSGRVVESLGSAFRSTSVNYQVAAAKALSDILEKHESAVVRVDHMIAVKVTRNGKVRTLITVLPPPVEAALRSDPTLVSKPEQLLQFIEAATSVTPISSARKVSKAE